MQATKYWTNPVDNDEVFGPAEFETKEEALEDGMKWAREDNGKTVYVGRVNCFKPDITSYTGELLYGLQNDAEVEAGEQSAGYLKNVTDEDYNELCEMLQAAYDRWEKKHPEYKPDFFTVTDVEEFQVE